MTFELRAGDVIVTEGHTDRRTLRWSDPLRPGWTGACS